MREIKFRGLRTNNKELVYGHYVVDPSGQHRIYWRPFDTATSNTYHFVIPETVGQYTGLKDKNGVEIYEGDIVKYFTYRYKKGVSRLVEWDEQGMWIPFRDDEHIQDEQGDWFDHNKGFEVIGNIHEHTLNKEH